MTKTSTFNAVLFMGLLAGHGALADDYVYNLGLVGINVSQPGGTRIISGLGIDQTGVSGSPSMYATLAPGLNTLNVPGQLTGTIQSGVSIPQSQLANARALLGDAFFNQYVHILPGSTLNGEQVYGWGSEAVGQRITLNTDAARAAGYAVNVNPSWNLASGATVPGTSTPAVPLSSLAKVSDLASAQAQFNTQIDFLRNRVDEMGAVTSSLQIQQPIAGTTHRIGGSLGAYHGEMAGSVSYAGVADKIDYGAAVAFSRSQTAGKVSFGFNW